MEMKYVYISIFMVEYCLKSNLPLIEGPLDPIKLPCNRALSYNQRIAFFFGQETTIGI